MKNQKNIFKTSINSKNKNHQFNFEEISNHVSFGLLTQIELNFNKTTII